MQGKQENQNDQDRIFWGFQGSVFPAGKGPWTGITWLTSLNINYEET